MTARDVARDLAFEGWIARGRAVRVVEELGRRGHLSRLKRVGTELAGPCPLCGGTDRFGVNPSRNVWNCRGCGIGGDAIKLVRNVDGVDFLQAIEILTGEPRPGALTGESAAEREIRHAAQTARIAEAEAADARKANEQAGFRERERLRMWDVWKAGRPIGGTVAESYLARRRVVAPAEAHLRLLPNHALWDGPPPNGTMLHRGPAMAAAIVGPTGKFAGLHVTWIDLIEADGKARVADPATGEFVPAKKVRGSKKGGSILLARPARAHPRVLFIGEGIETVLSVYCALAAAGAPVLDHAEFRSSVDLGNLSGRAKGRVPHPSETTVDTRGRVRRALVGDAVPHPDDRDAVIAIEASIDTVVMLGDGDSEPFRTRLALERGAARFAAAFPWLTIGLAMSPEGQDFNDLWREAPESAVAPAADAAADLCGVP